MCLDGEIGRHKGLKIPRLETAVPVRLRLEAPNSRHGQWFYGWSGTNLAHFFTSSHDTARPSLQFPRLSSAGDHGSRHQTVV